MRSLFGLSLLAVTTGCLLALAACGGDDDEGQDAKGTQGAATQYVPAEAPSMPPLPPGAGPPPPRPADPPPQDSGTTQDSAPMDSGGGDAADAG